MDQITFKYDGCSVNNEHDSDTNNRTVTTMKTLTYRN